MGTTLLRLVGAIAFVVVLFGSPSRAEAKGKIPIVFQTGQTMFESGPLPAPYDKDSALIGATAGYVCDVTGVFWSYITIDDCQPAAIRGNTFDTSPDLAAAVRAAYPEPTIPFWAEHGWKLMAGGLVFFVVLCVILGLRSSDDDEEVATEGRGGDKPQTQFHMAVVEPQLAKDRTAAFEGSTARPSAPDHQPAFVEGFSGRRGSQPAIVPLAAEAQRDSQPAFADRAPSQPALAPQAYAATPAQAPQAPAQAQQVYAQTPQTFAPTPAQAQQVYAPPQAFAPTPAQAQQMYAPQQAQAFAPTPAHAQPAFAPNRGSQPAPLNAQPSGPITGYEPTAPLRPEPVVRSRPDVVPPPIARPNAMVIAPHLSQPSPQAVAYIAPAPAMTPAQPMRQSPPSMPPAMVGMPQPAYAHVDQPVAPTVAIQRAHSASQSGSRSQRPSQHPQRDINEYLVRPSQYQRAQREGSDAWPQRNMSLGTDAPAAALVAHGSQQPALAQGSQPSSHAPSNHGYFTPVSSAQSAQPTQAPQAFAQAPQAFAQAPQAFAQPAPAPQFAHASQSPHVAHEHVHPAYAPMPHASAPMQQAFAPSAQPVAMPSPVAASLPMAPQVQPPHASLAMPQPKAPQVMSPQAMQAMLSRPVNHGAPSTKPAIAVPMPERPSIQPLANARAAAAQPRPVTARPMPVLPAVPPSAAPIQSGPPEMPPSIGHAQPTATATPARAKRPSEPPALPVERRFEDAHRAPSSPIGLLPGVPQYARSPVQATRQPAHVMAPHLLARGSQPPAANAAVGRAPTEPADVAAQARAQAPADDDVDAKETDEFVDEAATVLSADAPAMGMHEDNATDVMDALDEAELLAALAPLGGDGPTHHDASSQKRARSDYNQSRRMARGSDVGLRPSEQVDLHAPIAPELMRATLKIDDPKPHPYVTTRFRRS